MLEGGDCPGGNMSGGGKCPAIKSNPCHIVSLGLDGDVEAAEGINYQTNVYRVAQNVTPPLRLLTSPKWLN